MTGTLLIINADDFGYDPAISEGIRRAILEGVVTSTTMMVNTPFSELAAKAASGLSIGLHLNLARYRPVGAKFPAEFLLEGEFSEGVTATIPEEVVEAETLAQLDRLQRLIDRVATHIDVHKHLHRHPNVLEGVCRAAAARSLPVRTLDPAMRHATESKRLSTCDEFVGDAGNEPYWTLPQLELRAARLPPSGVVEWMCHPGLAPTHVTTSYSTQRLSELATFTDPRAVHLLRESSARLGTYGDL